MASQETGVLRGRFPLWAKFAFLLAGFILAISLVVFTNIRTSNQIQADLAAVKEQEFPRYSVAASMVTLFEHISKNFQESVETGERGLLAQNASDRDRFLKLLARFMEMTPGSEQKELVSLRDDFQRYYSEASTLASMMLGDASTQLNQLSSDRIAALGANVPALNDSLQKNLNALEDTRRQSLRAMLERIIIASRRQSRQDAAFGIIATALLIIFLFNLARRITVPITALSRMTAEVARGNFEPSGEIRYLGQDEVGDLAHSFAEMTRGLKETTVSKDYVDGIIESMADMLVVIDSDDNIRTVNRATLSLLGYTPEQLLGKPANLIFPDVEALTTAGMRRTYSAAVLRDSEKVYVARDGRQIPVSLSASVLFSPNGQMQGFVCLAQDMTERKKSEEALRRANADLAEARDQALAANQTKSQFLATMSHELRTPLNAIIGYSEMLQEEAEDLGEAAFTDDLKKIQAAGKHLLGLINDILDISKIEAGKMQLYLEDFEVRALIEDVVSTVRPLVAKNANELVVNCEAGIGPMHADMTRVRQILFNLLSNASKFTKQGRIELTVFRDSVWFYFVVKDSGIGMTPEQVQKLFTPFSQAEAGTTRKYGGTGLGLTITKFFCTRMNGELTLESNYGSGTTFTAKIPARVVEIRDEDQTLTGTFRRPTRAGEASIPQNARMVLVIDDDSSSREILARYLTKDGFRVELASGGEEGLRMAKQMRPDAITLDVIMPAVDGWKVLAELKSDANLAGVPVLLISMIDNHGMGLTLGASEFLRKPIDYMQLSAALRKHLGAKSSVAAT